MLWALVFSLDHDTTAALGCAGHGLIQKSDALSLELHSFMNRFA
jgi:hypothetical protein